MTSATAMADVMPDICKTAVNYGAAALQLRFYDKSIGNPYDPNSVTLKKDLQTFPISNVKYLGNCDEDYGKLKDSWCVVAGGSPDVYQATVSRVDQGNTYAVGTVVVTYNRGGCWMDEVSN